MAYIAKNQDYFGSLLYILYLARERESKSTYRRILAQGEPAIALYVGERPYDGGAALSYLWGRSDVAPNVVSRTMAGNCRAEVSTMHPYFGRGTRDASPLSKDCTC